jgi:predicted Fe-S protein YdhL (DUF1289 family)
MNRKYVFTTIVVALLTVAGTGCSKEIHDEAWYDAHPKERESVLADCHKHEVGFDANCRNASMSQTDAELKKPLW